MIPIVLENIIIEFIDSASTQSPIRKYSDFAPCLNCIYALRQVSRKKP